MPNFQNIKNLVYQSKIIGDKVHIGDIYNVNGISRSIPLQLNTLPFIATSEVIGREQDLQKVYELLQISNRVVLVNGIGGIGKTTLAKYFIAHWRQQYNYVAWISVSTDIKEAFVGEVELLDSLHLREEIKQLSRNEQWIDTAFSLIINRMRQLDSQENQRKNLLIIDNVGEGIEHTKILDQIALRPNWKVLVTSREKLIGFEEYELGFLSMEDAKELFYLHYQSEQDDGIVEEIIEIVGRHTLTIELLSKTINTNPLLNLKQLKKLLHERGISIKKEIDIKLSYSRIQGYTTITNCLKVAFDISGLGGDNNLLLLMRKFSVLPSHPISLETLMKIFQVDEESTHIFINNLNKLVSKGWVTKSGTDYRMHIIIADIIRRKLEPKIQNCENLIDFFINGIDKEVNANPHRFFESIKYIIYIEYLLRHIPSECIKTARLLNQLSELLRINGEYNKALKYQLNSIRLKESILSDTDIELAVSYNNIGIIYRNLAKYNLAYQVLSKALEIYENTPNTNSRLFADTYNNISVVSRYLGNTNLALKYQFKSIEKGKVDGYRLDYSYNSLSIIYRQTRELEQALKYRKMCHELFENQSPLSPNLPASYNSWGVILVELEKYKEGIEKFESAIFFHKEIFKKEDTNLAVYYQQLGRAYMKNNDLDKVMEWLKKAKKIQEGNGFNNHPDYANTLNCISLFHQEKGQKSLAIDFLQKVISIHEKSKDNPIIKTYLTDSKERLFLLLEEVN